MAEKIASLTQKIKDLEDQVAGLKEVADSGLLDLLIDDYATKELEGVSVPVLRKLRLLRGDEMEAGAETEESTGDGGGEE